MRDARIYILPTRFGLVFLSGAILMILIGAAYQNNLVNMLAFFMLSLVFIAMIQTHNNLRDVRIDALETEGGFAGGEFIVASVLGNRAKTPRFNLDARLKSPAQKSVYENVMPLLGKATLKLKASYAAEKRGIYRLRRARLSSVYPLGLFEAWAWFDVSAKYCVYPEPKGQRPFPSGSSFDDGGHVSHPHGGDDFHGHRKFNLGDSHRHIDWKAYARGRPLLVKEFTEGAPGSALLDWYMLEGLDTEERLSQLARWILDARDRQLVFALRLPSLTIPAGQGLDHAVRCWEALAAYGSTDTGAAA